MPQVRLIRSRPSTFIPTAPARRKDRRRDDEGDTDIIVGETIDVKIDRFPKPKQKNFLEDPSVMTLVSQHRVEIDEDADAEPKVFAFAYPRRHGTKIDISWVASVLAQFTSFLYSLGFIRI